jgi:dihydroxyacetone kinase-like protein
MMPTSLTCADLVRLLAGGANRVKENQDLLSRLDSATGDGDHGLTMRRTADAMLESVGNPEVKAVGPLLESLAWSVMSVDGGSASPLLGSFFLGMAETADTREEWDAAGLSALLTAGLDKLRRQTPAQVGDKTMLDALVPAVEAFRQAAQGGSSPRDAFAAAAQSAAQGAESTKALQARFGRARNLGPRTIGHVDPGATSVSLLFAGFRDGLGETV